MAYVSDGRSRVLTHCRILPGRLLLVCFLLFPAIAVTEEDSFDDLSLEELLSVKVSTASRSDESIEDAPASVYVISKDDIRKRGYSVLSDALKDLPGMDVVENYFSEMGTLVTVRGVVGNNKIILLVNGMRVNPPGGEELMIRGDVSVRAAKQIEVIYGPGTTLYGQDAISCVINIVTEKPEEIFAGEASVAHGSNDARDMFFQFGSNLGAEQQLDSPLRMSGFASYRDSDLDDLNEEYPDWWSSSFGSSNISAGTPPKREDRGLNTFTRIENDNSSVQVWYRNSRRSSSEGGYTGILYYVDEAIWEDSSLVVEARNTFQISAEVSLESKVTYNRYEIDPAARYVFPISENELFFNDFKYGIGSGTVFEEVVRYTPESDFSMIAGVQYGFYDIIPKATIPGGADTDGNIVEQGGEFSYFTEAGNPASMMTIPRATNLNYENHGIFVEGRYDATEALSFIAGLRLDSDSRYDEEPLSPRLAALYQDSRNDIAVKLIYTEAFVSPAPYFGYNVFDNGAALNIANADLEPEQAKSTELNIVWSPNNFQIGTSLYYNTQKDLILIGDLALPANIVSDEVFVNADGTGSRLLTNTANAGESTAKGIDLYARYAQGRTSLWSSYSYVDFESKVDGITTGLQQTSKHNARLGVTYEVVPKVFVTPSIIYRSKLENVMDDFGLNSEIDDPFEVNLNVLYSPTNYMDLFLNVRNLTDEKNALKGVISPTPQEGVRGHMGVRFRF